MNYMLLPLKRYADFSGRSRRKEYWMFVLGYVLLAVLFGVVPTIFGATGEGRAALPAIFLVVIGLGLLIPSLAVQVRRFHDQDKSGWMVLLAFIPFVGGIIVLVFMCLEGTRGPNRYGADPKNQQDIAEVFN